MEVEESVLDSLPVPEQLFVVLNGKRVKRGLPPIGYMSAQLNAVAAQTAASATDVLPPTALSDGTAVTYGGAIWAGLSSVLGRTTCGCTKTARVARPPRTRRARRRRLRLARCIATSSWPAPPRAEHSLRCSPWGRRTIRTAIREGRWPP